MRNSESKKPIIVCCVTAILFLVLAFATFRERTAGVEETLFHTAIDPVQSFVNSLTASVTDFFERVFYPSEIQQENAALKKQVEALERDLLLYGETAKENARLQELLDYVQSNSGLRFVTAAVTARSLTGSEISLTLNVGTRHGVATEMPVVTGDGVIGRVTETGNAWCKVHTLLNDEMRISVMVERTRDEGTLGGLILENGEVIGIKLYYLPTGADIKIGDTIITSGIGGVFPKGIRVGEVVSIPTEENAAYDAGVFPSVDFTHLENVIVVLGVDEVKHD